MLKAISGWVAPKTAGLFGGAMRRTMVVAERINTSESLANPLRFAVLGAALFGGPIMRTYGESLSNRKFFFMKDKKVKGKPRLRRPNEFQGSAQTQKLLEEGCASHSKDVQTPYMHLHESPGQDRN